MQEIRRSGQDSDGTFRERFDRLTGYESAELAKAFDQRRAAAMRFAAETGEKVEVREVRGIGRNDPCPCGSGTKFKKCCGRNLAAGDARVK